MGARQGQACLLLVMLGIILNACAIGEDISSVTRASSGRQVLTALADSSVTLILLEVEWISLDEADCPPNAPVLINRNITLRGNAARPTALNMNYLRHKFRLQNGTMIRLQNTMIYRTRAGPASLAVGIDLFAPTFPGEEAIQWIEDGYIVYQVCFNAETYHTFTTVTVHNPMPPQLPPGNMWEVPVPLPSPPGVCKNVTDALTPEADPSVHLLDRCYALAGRCLITSLYGADLQPVTGNAVKNGYLVHMLRVNFFCPEVLSSECITARGPLGCGTLWHSQNRMTWLDGTSSGAVSSTDRDSPPPPPLTPPLLTPGGSGQGQGQGQGGNTAVSSELKNGSGGGGDSAGVPVAAIAAIAGGGLALLAVGITAALLWRRRRQGGDGAGADGGMCAKEETTAAAGDTNDDRLTSETAEANNCGLRIYMGSNEGAAPANTAATTTTTATVPSTPRAAAEAASPAAATTTAATASQVIGVSGGLASAGASAAATSGGTAGVGGGGCRARTEYIAAANGTGSCDLTEQAALAALPDPAGRRGSGGAGQQQCPMAPVTPWTPLQQSIDLRVKATHATAAADDSGGAAQSAASADASASAAAGSSSSGGSNEVKLLPITLGKGTFGRVVVGEFRGLRVAVKLVNLNLAAWEPPPLPAAAAIAAGGADTAAASIPATAGRSGPADAAAADAACGGGTLAILAGGSGTGPTRYLWEQANNSIQQPHTLGLGLTAAGVGDRGGASAAAALAGFSEVVAAAGPTAWRSPGAAWLQPPAGLPEAAELWNPDPKFPIAAADGHRVSTAGDAAAAHVEQQSPQHQHQSVLAAPTAAAPTMSAAGPMTHANGSTTSRSNLQWITFPRGAAAAATDGDTITESALSSLPAGQQDGRVAASEAAPLAPVTPPTPPPVWNGAGIGPTTESNGVTSLTTTPGALPTAASAAPAAGALGAVGLLTALPTLRDENAGGGGRMLQHIRGAKGTEGDGEAADGEDGPPVTVAGASTFCGSTTNNRAMPPVPAAPPPPAKAKAAGAPQGPLTAARNKATGLQKSFIAEVEVLARIQHPNIVQLLAACIEPPQMCLVIELMDTSLERLLYGGGPSGGPRPFMPLGKVLHVAIQVCEALAYLHPTIIHRDLKPGNVLISNPNSDTPIVKLADFGLSKLQTTVQFTWHADAGTAAYMAPETLNPYNHAVMHHVDMYAVGVMLWEMLAGQRPWAGLSIAQIAYSVGLLKQRPPLDGAAMPPGRCPPKLRALVQACWDQDPKRRPAASEVLKELTLLRFKIAQQSVPAYA